MEEKRGFKITRMIIEANKQIYEDQDNEIVLTYDEDGTIQWKLSANLYDMMTESERKKIDQLAHFVSELLSCVSF